MGIGPRIALGIVALLALAHAPATTFVSPLTEQMPEAVAAGIAALAPVRPAEAASHPVARPEEISRGKDEPALDRSEVLRPGMTRQSGDLACLAEAIYFEARGTGADGESAVAHVVVNRAKARSFPNSVCGVVHDGCQFSYRCDGRPDALAEAGARARAFRAADAVLDGAPDITGGALYFHSARAKGGLGGHRKLGVFGGNVFYR